MKRFAILFLIAVFSIPAFSQGQEYIRSIYFGGGSAYIDARQALELKEFIESIPNLENYQISISSHTDNIGGKEYNQWLSEMRSESTIQQLVKNNITGKESVALIMVRKTLCLITELIKEEWQIAE